MAKGMLVGACANETALSAIAFVAEGLLRISKANAFRLAWPPRRQGSTGDWTRPIWHSQWEVNVFHRVYVKCLRPVLGRAGRARPQLELPGSLALGQERLVMPGKILPIEIERWSRRFALLRLQTPSRKTAPAASRPAKQRSKGIQQMPRSGP